MTYGNKKRRDICRGAFFIGVFDRSEADLGEDICFIV